MKIKWHWGTRLLVAMILFMALIIGFVIMSMKQDFFLVERDYYPKAIEYQDKIDKMRNAEALSGKIIINNLGSELEFLFPEGIDFNDLGGQILFYRPSDGGQDLSFPIQVDSAGRQRCQVADMAGGKYIVKIDYHTGSKGFYQEESVFLKMH